MQFFFISNFFSILDLEAEWEEGKVSVSGSQQTSDSSRSSVRSSSWHEEEVEEPGTKYNTNNNNNDDSVFSVESPHLN